MSPVMGKGFSIKDEFEGYKYDFPVQNIVLVATGTGIAPIRAAIESGMLEVDTTGPFGRR
jgi:NAD(P)H-flavin reductase